MALNVSWFLLPLAFPSSPLTYVNHSNACAASENLPLAINTNIRVNRIGYVQRRGKRTTYHGRCGGVDPLDLFPRPSTAQNTATDEQARSRF
jgi:hypothetical protein